MVERSRVRGTYRVVTLSVVASLLSFTGRVTGEGGPAPATRPASTQGVVPGIGRQQEESPPRLAVGGTVVDDRTGSPVPEFNVTYGDDRSIPYWQHKDAKRFTGGRFDYELPPHFFGKEARIQVRAKGYKDAASRIVRRTEQGVTLEFRLVPPERFAGRARLPDGGAAAGASVLVVTPGNYLLISNAAPAPDELLPPLDARRTAKADDAGRFEVDVDCERCRVVVLHDGGFADVAATAAARKAAEVSLQLWGSVACSVELDGKPAAGLTLEAEPHDEGSRGADDDPRVDFDGRATTGADGKCVLERVPPGKAVLSIREPREWGGRDRHFGTLSVRNTPVEVPPGGSARVRLGGGASVTGRFTAGGRDVPWESALARLYPHVTSGSKPADWREEVLWRHGIPVAVRPDGTFRATDVPPGNWRIDSMFFLPGAEGPIRLRQAGRMPGEFTVKQAAVDLGDVPAKFRTALNPGDAAPDFEVTTLDGKRLRLTDLRGKYVVLDFWATWCGPCVRDLPFLKRSWEALKGQPDVVVLGLSVDKTDEPVRPFVAQHGYGWTHAVIGEGSKVKSDYGVEYIPTMWLVLPDGKLATTAADALPEQIARHREKAAGQSRP